MGSLSKRTIVIPLFVSLFITVAIASASSRTSTEKEPPSALARARDALIQGKVDEAVPLLKEAVAGPEREEALFRLASALHTLGRREEALSTAKTLLREFPGGTFRHKARFLQAALLEALGRRKEAADIYEEAVQRLLSKERKEEVARFYTRYAQALADPKREGGPDYGRAVELYRHALELEIPGPLDADLRLRIAELQHEMKRYADEVKTLEAFRKRYPTYSARDEVAYRLAEARRLMGRTTEARRGFRDLIRLHPASVRVPEAWYGIARTYGFPKPQNDRDLALGVKALEAFLAAAPRHEKAPAALLDMGTAYLHRGRYDEAVAAFQRLVHTFEENPAVKEKEVAEARFRIAGAFLAQQRFEKALAAFNTFLAEHPNHHLWDDAQRAVVETEYAWSVHLFEEKRYEEARDRLTAFSAHHPLDAHTPQACYLLGRIEEERKDYAGAVSEWKRLASKYPDTEAASLALFRTGLVYETRIQDLEKALDAYGKVKGKYQSEARARMKLLRKKSLVVTVKRAFRTSETPVLEVATRNIESLSFRAYKVDLRDYFMQHHGSGGVEKLDIDLIQPDEEWKSDVEGYRKYAEITREEKLPFTGPGVYLVHASDGERAAVVPVLVTDLQVIVKSGRKDVIVFAENTRTREAFPGVEVLVSDGKKILFQGTTGPDGVFHHAEGSLERARSVRVLACAEGHFASNALDLGKVAVAEGLSPKAYLFTDRTVYRPGTEIRLKGFVREVEKGRYFFDPGAAYTLTLEAPGGGEILRREVRLDDFGSLDTALALAPDAPLGTYRFTLRAPSGWTRTLPVRVLQYARPRAELSIDLSRTVYFPGEAVEGTLRLRYAYGEPARDVPVRYSYGPGIVLEDRTDEQGEVHFRFDTQDFAESGTYAVTAEAPAVGASARKAFHFSTTGFSLSVAPSREVILAGESLSVKVKAEDPGGKPAAAEGALRVIRLVEDRGATVEREVKRLPFSVPEKEGYAAVSVPLEEGGRYRFRAAAKDRFGNLVTADGEAFVSGEADKVKLRLFADRPVYDAGAAVEIEAHLRCAPGPALVTCEGERVFSYRVVRLVQGMNTLPLEITDTLAPNFTFAAALMDENRLHTAAVDLRVRASLRVKVEPEAKEVPPGGKVPIRITVTDRAGKPVEGEFALALVDAALLARFPDTADPIHAFFFGRERKGRLATSSSCTFAFKARAEAIDRALLEEAARRRAALAEKGLELEGALVSDLEALEEVQEGKLAFKEARKKALRPAAGPATAGVRLRREMKGAEDAKLADKLKSLGYVGAGDTVPPAESESLGKKVNAVVGVGGGAGGRFRGKYAGNVVAACSAGRGLRSQWNAGEGAALRRRFLETAYWNPSVRTGPDGTARIEAPLPDNITTWKIRVRGLSRGAAGGQAEAEVRARKRLFVALEAPERLVEGDATRVHARVVNAGKDAIEAAVTLSLQGDAEPGSMTRKVSVPAGEDAVVTFEAKAPRAGTIRAELTARAGDLLDTVKREIPVDPYGVAITSGAGGTAEASAEAAAALPGGRTYTHRSMEITVGPSFSDLLVHLADSEKHVYCRLPSNTDRAARLQVMLAAVDYLRRTGRKEAIRASRLEVRIEEALSALLLAQERSGAFTWMDHKGGESVTATAEGLKALALAHRLGFPVPEKNRASCRERLKNLLRSRSDRVKLYGLQALSLDEKPDFTELNRLFRVRNRLDDGEAALLALAFARSGYKDQAGILLDLLLERNVFAPGPVSVPREAKTRPVEETDAPWLADRLMTQAHALAALCLARPGDPAAKQGAETVTARLARSWHPAPAVAAAARALSAYLSGAAEARSRYDLAVSVNGRLLKRLRVDGPSKVETLDVPEGMLRDGENRVSFAYEGRGAYTYAVRLTGFTPEVKPMPYDADHPFYVKRRYLQAPLTYEGKEFPSGFDTVVLPRGAETWKHELSELNEGETAKVTISTGRLTRFRNHPVVVVDTLPAGCRVVESGIRGNYARYELGEGTITFYSRDPSFHAEYTVAGTFEGKYRIPPPVMRSLYDYGLYTHGAAFDLPLHARDTKKRTPYRMTPDELYHLGVRLFEDGKKAEAKARLQAFLENGFAPRERYLVDAAEKLFKIAFEEKDDEGLIRYFELLRERAPHLSLSFQESARVASAYRKAGEYEQALQLFAAIAGASFGRESKVAETLEKEKEYEGAVEYMKDLIAAYPDLPLVQNAAFALGQAVMDKAGPPGGRPAIPGRTRKELLLRGVKLIRAFLAAYPENPIADEAAYSLVSTCLDLELSAEAARLCPLFIERWPKSRYRRSLEYAEAFALFELGRYDEARKILTFVADRSERGLTPMERDDRNLARYLLGQIEHAAGRIEAALQRYGQVKDFFEDAKEAIAYFTHKSVSLPEVTEIAKDAPVSVELTYRNVPEVKLSVYKVDLMKLYLARKSLKDVTDVNLAGIRPALSTTIPLGDGKDYRDRKKKIELDLEDPGAYLLVVQGKDAACSGMVLKSDLALEVQEETASGRVRVNAKDRNTGAFLKNVYVKVIGSRNTAFQSGYTDLRGVFTADNVSGTSAVIAEREGAYAFHRGTVELQPKPAAPSKAQRGAEHGAEPARQYKARYRALQNVFGQNRQVQQRGRRILNDLYQQADEEVNIK